MVGAESERIRLALATYENDVGPGQYELPSVFGRRQSLGKLRNSPGFSMGVKRNLHVDPETRNIIPSTLKSPSPADYQKPHDNINFRRNSAIIVRAEQKFFKIANMNRLKSSIPI
jgi:hypothetical protein